MQEVKVTNRHTFPLTDHHLGIEYVFNPGEETVIPLEAAVHLFGLGLKDRTAAMKRAGKTNLEAGTKYLNGFDLNVVEYVTKDEADEIDGLKIALEGKDKSIQEMQATIDRLEAEKEQLGKLVDKVKTLESKLAEYETKGKK